MAKKKLTQRRGATAGCPLRWDEGQLKQKRLDPPIKSWDDKVGVTDNDKKW